MEDPIRAKQALRWIPVTPCRPRITWSDAVWRDNEPMCTTSEDVYLKAIEREEWEQWTDRRASYTTGIM